MADGPGDRGTVGLPGRPGRPVRLVGMDDERDHRDLLLEAGLALSSERSLPAILQRIVELATQLTGARYGAIGVLGTDGGISQFIYTGISPEQREAIGDLPVGKGILGALIQDARPLRLRDLHTDPRSVGFPPDHPPMRSFLGAPVMARGRVFGNIYLTEKQGAVEFDAGDEWALVVLAAQAGVAVENAHLNEELEARVARLDALHAISTAIVQGEDTDAVTTLVARHARALLRADLASVAVPTRDREHLEVRTADGIQAGDMLGEVFSSAGSVSGDVIATGRVIGLPDAAVDDRVAQPIVQSGVFGPALFVPLAARGEPLGTLLLGRRRGGPVFDEGEIRLAEVFAEQAAVVLEQARLQREVHRLETLEDRERIARELHDGTIQSLFTVGLGLQGTASLVGQPEAARRIEGAVGELDRVIRDLRNYIFGLEPGVLADRQLGEALEEMVEEFQHRKGVVAVAEIDPDAAAALGADAADILQLAREALSNVGRHANATTCRVSLHQEAGDGRPGANRAGAWAADPGDAGRRPRHRPRRDPGVAGARPGRGGVRRGGHHAPGRQPGRPVVAGRDHHGRAPARWQRHRGHPRDPRRPSRHQGADADLVRRRPGAVRLDPGRRRRLCPQADQRHRPAARGAHRGRRAKPAGPWGDQPGARAPALGQAPAPRRAAGQAEPAGGTHPAAGRRRADQQADRGGARPGGEDRQELHVERAEQAAGGPPRRSRRLPGPPHHRRELTPYAGGYAIRAVPCCWSAGCVDQSQSYSSSSWALCSRRMACSPYRVRRRSTTSCAVGPVGGRLSSRRR